MGTYLDVYIKFPRSWGRYFPVLQIMKQNKINGVFFS